MRRASISPEPGGPFTVAGDEYPLLASALSVATNRVLHGPAERLVYSRDRDPRP